MLCYRGPKVVGGWCLLQQLSPSLITTVSSFLLWQIDCSWFHPTAGCITQEWSPLLGQRCSSRLAVRSEGGSDTRCGDAHHSLSHAARCSGQIDFCFVLFYSSISVSGYKKTTVDCDFVAVKQGLPQCFSVLHCQLFHGPAEALQMLSFECSCLIVFILSVL